MAAILVIDDDPFFQEFLNIVLSGEGHAVAVAADGQAGFDAAVAAPPDLIICDMNMPGLTGFETIRLLKGNDAVRDVPVIGLSAHGLSGDRDEAHEVGCDAYETKPIDADRLIFRVDEVLAEGRG